jgi:phage recombination protein Bet
MSDALTVIQTDHGEVKLSPAIVKKFLVNGQGNVTDQEVTMFIALCKYQNLNPFLREAYLVKYGSSPATIVTGKEVFTKRASKLDKCEGWESGITVLTADNQLIRRAGTLVLDGEKLVGGWCKVHRKDWKVPIEHEVSMTEFNKNQSSWKTMPATMIRKVAIVSGLRDAFPEDFQGMYDSAEMPVDSAKLEDKPVEIGEENEEPQEELVGVYDDGDPELPWNKNKGAQS